jgi:hypothetical protein
MVEPPRAQADLGEFINEVFVILVRREGFPKARQRKAENCS